MISPAVITATNSGATKYGLKVEILQENIQITEDAITGKLNKVNSYPEFGDAEATKPGHYLALDVEVPDGATVTTKIEGGTQSDYVDLTEDKFCVYRIKDTSQKIKIKTQKGEEEVEKTYDLTGLSLEAPVGKDAFDASKSDYGGFGKLSDFYDDGLTVTWEGTKATVKGTLKWAESSTKRPTEGNYYPFALISDYKGKDITVNNGGTVNTVQDTDWVCKIEEKTKSGGLMVKCGDTLIANFDFSGVTLAQKNG